MVRSLPARHSKHNYSVVRQKEQRGSRQRSRGLSHAAPHSRKYSSVGIVWRVFGGAVMVGLVLAVVGYFVFQTMVQQALDTSSQTVIFVPKTVEDAPTEIRVITLARDIRESAIVSAPADMMVQLPAGYGNYRVGAVYPLLQLDGKDTQFIQASYSKSLGIVIDAVVPLTSFERRNPELRAVVLRSVWNWLWNRDQTSLVILKTWLFLKETPEPIQTTSLAELQQQVVTFESKRQAVQECPVGILNASETAGAAGSLSKLLESAKILTIRVGTFPQDADQTKIYHDGRPECAQVLQRLTSTLLYAPPITMDTQMTRQYRSAIVVVLGKDLQ